MTLTAVTCVHIYINTNKLNKVKVGLAVLSARIVICDQVYCFVMFMSVFHITELVRLVSTFIPLSCVFPWSRYKNRSLGGFPGESRWIGNCWSAFNPLM